MLIQYDTTWERVLTEKQKTNLQQQANELELGQQVLSVKSIFIKKKRNDGIVTTVFLINNSDTSLQLDELKVQLLDGSRVIAEETFSLHLSISARRAMPWSFVFSPELIQEHPRSIDHIKVVLPAIS